MCILLAVIEQEYYFMFMIHSCIINVVLAIFNLVLIPPLDGSRVAIGFLPADLVPKYLRLERFGFLIVFGLLWPAEVVIFLEYCS